MIAASQKLSAWVRQMRFDDLPDDVVTATMLRVIDVVGLSIAGSQRPFGMSVRSATAGLHPGTEARIWGGTARSSVSGAAFANGALSQALEYDDTHNESIVHMSSPAVAAALALGDRLRCGGRDAILAIAIGNEISCRVGSLAPGQFHKRGFHPSGLFAPFGVSWLAGKMLALEEDAMIRAAGITGSFAAGLIQCWVDGTQSKFLHPGWAAQSGIAAATLAEAGVTGPAEVLEGRFGLYASHLQDEAVAPDWRRLTDALGEEWESRNASFKPFPAAHVIHPYVSALLRLRERHGLSAERIRAIRCDVAPYIVGIVCEPQGEKLHPLTDSHGRVSLQYTLAEALVRGRLGKDAYQPEYLRDEAILSLARRVEYRVDRSLPGPEQFKGVISVELTDGTVLEEIEEHNRGSSENPMTTDEIVAKFNENVAGTLTAAQARRLVDAALALDRCEDVSRFTELTVTDHE
ncbi:MmgE/PrpD family protein [Sphingobium sp. PNB]|uniref:MmgE/PrpD family protein n=1 Tax=Sphingobium sp. PNB TaxID=863934 RepID=UPI0029BFC39E|nr:MmgE/PrpD family protein [Sphingobium sp. PNB]MCB4860690.1 MmgE/PrpD family protein [Sphingobium sp. PNB]